MQRSNLIIEPPQTKLTNGSNVVSPSTNGNDKPILMTRRELTDPFGSDEEDEEKIDSKGRNVSPPKELMSPPAIDNVSSENSKEILKINFLCLTFTENCKPT